MKRTLMLGIIILAGCATVAPPVQHMATFSDSSLAWAAAPGVSTVTGQAFLKTVGGEVKYGAGTPVYLLPASDYTAEWFNAVIVQGTASTGPADVAVSGHLHERQTTSDGSGHFTFTGVPAGKYFLWTAVYWGVPGGYGTVSQTGGQAYGIATVTSGDTVSVVLTR